MVRKNSRKSPDATLHQVAALACVSPMTVSRVINQKPNISKSMRDRVVAALEQLQYRPNLAARALAGVRGPRIAFVYSNPSSAYLSELLTGALAGAARMGTELIVESWHNVTRENEQEAAAFLAAKVEGVVLPTPLCDSKVVVAELTAAGIPIVAVGPGSPQEGISCVRIDDFRAAYELTSYLIKLGHVRIGFIMGHPDQSVSGCRLAGYNAAMDEGGMSVDKSLVRQGRFTYQSGLEAAECLLSLAKKPTAIFASNDDMAIAAVNFAHRSGIKIPDDLSIVGFDDLPIAENVWPTLTTVHQPVASMAEAAVTLLMRNIRGKAEGNRLIFEQILPYKLVVRDSTVENVPAIKTGETKRA